ncbi:hypothetical protein M2156_002859 [Streptomyces sp. SAI-149]|nr:hypothetical protein [Streptomyces sp. SAI-119]MDH6496640.1 hypothetical protein [Streptomyces sp. SAI-149]
MSRTGRRTSDSRSRPGERVASIREFGKSKTGNEAEDARTRGAVARMPVGSTGGALPPAEWALLAVAVVGISLAAPLAAAAAAPPLAIAFWRNAAAGA